MKKIYLTIIGFAALTSSFAQKVYESQSLAPKKIAANVGSTISKSTNSEKALGSVLWSNDFSNSSDWVIGAANLQGQWQIINTTTPNSYMGNMASTTMSNGYGYFNGVQYLVSGTVDPQDATLTYKDTFDFTAESTVEISFQQRYRAFNTDETWIEFSTNAGTTWTGIELNTDAIGNGLTLQNTKSINISALVGSMDSVMVRFRWINTSDDDDFGSGYGWMVDDISISSAADYNLTLLEPMMLAGTQELIYSKVPLNQISPIKFQGRILNNGSQDQTGVNLDVAITGGSTFSGTAASVLSLDTVDFVTETAFTPAAATIATYNFTYSATSGETEDVPVDNTATGSISITKSEYRVDNGVVIGGISNVSSEPTGALKIGNLFEIINDDIIDSMYITLSDATTNVGQEFFGEIWKYNGSDYEFLAQTDFKLVTSGNNGTTVKVAMQYNTDVYAGDLLLVMAGHSGGANSIEFATAQSLPTGYVLGMTSGNTADDIFQLTDPEAIMVGLCLNKDAGVKNLDNTVSSMSVYPNPTNGSSVVNYSLGNASEVSISVVDVAGKVIFSSNEGNKVAGKYTATIDAAAFNAGIYYVTISTNDSQLTQKLIKK